MKKIFAIASNGGHLVQLLRLVPAFDGLKLTLVSTSITAPECNDINNYYCVSDCNLRSNKFILLKSAFEVLFIYIKERPDIVISTGAAPGFFAIFYGWLFRKKIIWIDSIANIDKLSLSGKMALKLTKHCYTQWKPLSHINGPRYIGSVI